MDKPCILIVDDEPNVRFVLEKVLEGEGYLIDSAKEGGEAISSLQQNEYDLILLDLMMKPVDGLQVLDYLHKGQSDVIVIILTAHGSLDSAVEALRYGAFDYLVKPAMPEVIRQRVREGLAERQQVIRRKKLQAQIDRLRETLNELEIENESLNSSPKSSRFLYSDPLVIDLHQHQAIFNNQLLDLTTTELNILTRLVSESPRPVSPSQLVKDCLGYSTLNSEASEIVKWHIHRLRRKIEQDPARPKYIKTVRYQGYAWCD